MLCRSRSQCARASFATVLRHSSSGKRLIDPIVTKGLVFLKRKEKEAPVTIAGVKLWACVMVRGTGSKLRPSSLSKAAGTC